MRRIFSVLLALAITLLPLCAAAEIACVCGKQTCQCFLQIGDIGIAVEGLCSFLVEKNFLPAEKSVEVFNQDVYNAVIRVQEQYGLPATGMVDDDTLTCLIWGMTADELDVAEPDSNGNVNWIPTDGGVRMHHKKECSYMTAPRIMSIRNAWKLGIEPCGICNRLLRQQLVK